MVADSTPRISPAPMESSPAAIESVMESAMERLGASFEELMRQARGGDANALGSLLSWYVKYLTILASRQLDNRLRRRVSPSDVVQETMLAAHRDFTAFRGNSQGELLAWLRQIMIHSVHRAVATHLKAQKRDLRRDISIDQVSNRLEESACNLAGRLPATGDSPSTAMQRRERTVEFANRLSDLPEHYRDVIVMRILNGLSFDEIAVKMKKSCGAVRMLWLRALHALKVQEELSDGE